MEKTYDPNEEIFGEGAPANLIYKVVRGTVRNCKSLRNGRRMIDAFRLPGDIFGYDTADEREYSAEAVDDVSVIVVRRGMFAKRAPVCGGVGQEAWTAAELRRVQEHALLLVKNARQRVASFLLEMHSAFERCRSSAVGDVSQRYCRLPRTNHRDRVAHDDPIRGKRHDRVEDVAPDRASRFERFAGTRCIVMPRSRCT